MKFTELINTIAVTHNAFQKQAVRSVNLALTIRNWLLGWYIVEFEQKGDDRAKYGDNLLKEIAKKITKKGIKGLSFTSLNLCRQFYHQYPQIIQAVSEQFSNHEFKGVLLPNSTRKRKILQVVSEELIPSDRLLENLSFSHFVELLKISKPLKRLFYEVQSIKEKWSIRELKRQIDSLLYERTGLSKNKTKLLAQAKSKSLKLTAEQVIRDPYVFEFLGLKQYEVMSESRLENALLNHLQEFLLELGKGFCFEARQKRITIDGRHYYLDLLFYHRILKCHVLIDLKIGKFSHIDAGQMNFYLNYMKDNEMKEDDHAPIGIVLCATKNTADVKYATAGINNKVFVSEYLLQLPSEKELQNLIKKDLKLLSHDIKKRVNKVKK